jgi:regulator of replication initiation timing
MRNTKVAGQRPTTQTPSPQLQNQVQLNKTPAPTYAPAVPISIYRELSTELQATQVSVVALEKRNQQLISQNQLLRQELERIADRSQKTINHFDSMQADQSSKVSKASKVSNVLVEDYIEELPIVPEQFYRVIPDGSNAPTAPAFTLPQLPRPQIVYEQQIRPAFQSLSASSNELTGWKLSTVMALIIFSAFGAGFLVVRPLLAPK